MKCDAKGCKKTFKETNHFILGPGIEKMYCSDKCLRKDYYDMD